MLHEPEAAGTTGIKQENPGAGSFYIPAREF